MSSPSANVVPAVWGSEKMGYRSSQALAGSKVEASALLWELRLMFLV